MNIESLLSARLFVAPQLADGFIYFISNLSGRLSLYRMLARPGGSVPEPLLPPDIALQNPDLVGGHAIHVFPRLGQVLVMLDRDGDENYQPMLAPMTGGYPAPAFGDQLAQYRVHAAKADIERNIIYLLAESRHAAANTTFRGHLDTGVLERLAESEWGAAPDGVSDDHAQLVLNEGYTAGDSTLYWLKDGRQQVLYGTPLGAREPGQSYPPAAMQNVFFTPGNRGLLMITALFEDAYGLGYLDLAGFPPAKVEPVTITGARHSGAGELTALDHLQGNRYRLTYSIDGASWLYEGEFEEAGKEMRLVHVVAGEGLIANGVLESVYYERAGDRFVLAYSTATSPTQIYTVGGPDRAEVVQHTNERVLGIPPEHLSPGEEATFTSFDALRVSARLYLPAPALGFEGPRPLIYYIHGGPQSQERPDFAWFSMPLIQFLTLNGLAVFVPNVRGSTGYGLQYMKKVDRDWGGDDRLDHLHAMTQVLPRDPRLDVERTGVTGRSYGGYMTLTLAARHPELWSAACDMFGPYNLVSFLDRIPPTWKPYFRLAVGDPEHDRELLVERSPSTYFGAVACPLLVIQGKNDPRVVEPESRDVVERLRAAGKQVEYLMFENEGHDVLKHENKVRCYNAITDFFVKHLKP
jgi:dipeptidyl aminopeptidase/acylaminoacyl peptidase